MPEGEEAGEAAAEAEEAVEGSGEGAETGEVTEGSGEAAEGAKAGEVTEDAGEAEEAVEAGETAQGAKAAGETAEPAEDRDAKPEETGGLNAEAAQETPSGEQTSEQAGEQPATDGGGPGTDEPQRLLAEAETAAVREPEESGTV